MLYKTRVLALIFKYMNTDRETRSSIASSQNIFLQFAYLQLLDVMTTLGVLTAGGLEANPLVRAALSAFGNPIAALACVKGFAMLLAVFCWRTGRLRTLGRINMFYALLVAWNVLMLISATVKSN